MDDLRIATIRAIHDALALRGLEEGGGGLLRTAEPALYMSEDRLRLAREVLRLLPTGASILNAERLADELAPAVARAAKPMPAEPAPPMFHG